MSRTAIVVGGGIGGLSAGIALAMADYAVSLFEQAPELQPMGTALSIWRNAMAGLDWLGCGDALRDTAAPIEQVGLRDLRGKALFGPVLVEDRGSYLPLRTDLQSILLDALDSATVRLGTQVADVREDGDKVLALSAEGAVLAAGDLAVVADGIHSPIVTRLLGNVPVYAGYGGVLALSGRRPERAGLCEEIWGEHDRVGLFDTGRGGYWFYMASGAAADVQALDHAAICERVEAYPQTVRQMVAGTSPDGLIPVAIHSRTMPKRLGRGRIVCVGDAAHAMEPNQGQGACQAIEDSWALGVLAQRLAPNEILPEFERQRLKRIASRHRDSALIGRVAHSPRAWERRLVRSAFSLVPARFDTAQLRAQIEPPDYC